MTGLGRKEALGRLGHLFCEMYLRLEAVGQTRDYRCWMPPIRLQLADALGLSAVHINRTLRDMREAGLAVMQGSTLFIQAWAELVRVSEFTPAYLHLKMPTSE